MTTRPKFKSDAFEAVHSAAQGLHRAGTVDQATTSRAFDASCLTSPPEISPGAI
jgi:putative transcriptional regulator